MVEALLRDSDPVALVMMAIIVVSAATLVGTVVYRQRRRFPRWLRSIMVRRRLDMIRRDLYRMAERIGTPFETEHAAWVPFELGLQAMATCQWNQAIVHFQDVAGAGREVQLAPLLNQLGVCHYMQGRLGVALGEFEKSARLAEQRGDGQCRASALGNIGIIRVDYGEPDSALNALRQALAMARESGNQAAEAIHLGNIGNVLRQKGELGQALRSHEDALEISRRIGDQEGIASGLGNIGSIFRDKGERNKALARYAEAEELARKIDYRLGAVIQLSNIGNLYREKGGLDRAQKSHESALALAHEIGFQLGVATELVNIGLILVSRRMHERALSYLAESLAFFVAEGVTDGQRQGLYGLSKCDDSLGRERTQELLKEGGLTDEGVADTLDRIDHIRSRRPWQKDRRLNPFAPVRR